jgi:hypothetical protein
LLDRVAKHPLGESSSRAGGKGPTVDDTVIKEAAGGKSADHRQQDQSGGNCADGKAGLQIETGWAITEPPHSQP